MNTKSSKRPVVKIPISPTEAGLELVAVLGVIVGFVLICLHYSALPERIPTHFGLSGRPDGWGPKGMLLMLPGITLLMYAFLTIVNRLPHIYNYPVQITEENARRQYQLARRLVYWLKGYVVWLFVYIEWTAIRTALGRAEGLSNVVVFGVVALVLASAGHYMYRAWQAR